MRLNIQGVIACIAILISSSVAADDVVWFLYDHENSHHQRYVDESSKILRARVPAISIKSSGQDGDDVVASAGDNLLLITLGNRSAQQAAHFSYPTLNTLITRRSFESLKAIYHGPVSSIYLDQPVSRYFQLVKSALPERRQLTVLVRKGELAHVADIEEQARRQGLKVRIHTLASGDEIPRLFGQQLLARDTLLLLPDPAVVNRQTVKPLVLGSYRHGIPLVGYSAALVKSGALMAVYSPVSVLQSRMIEGVDHYFRAGVLQAPSYADDFAVSVNYQLARALSISLPAEEKLKNTIQERSR